MHKQIVKEPMGPVYDPGKCSVVGCEKDAHNRYGDKKEPFWLCWLCLVEMETTRGSVTIERTNV